MKLEEQNRRDMLKQKIFLKMNGITQTNRISQNERFFLILAALNLLTIPKEYPVIYASRCINQVYKSNNKAALKSIYHVLDILFRKFDNMEAWGNRRYRQRTPKRVEIRESKTFKNKYYKYFQQ